MYHKLNKDKIVYCDVDDTIILWEPEKYTSLDDESVIWIDDDKRTFPVLPHNRNIEFLKKLKLQGYGVVIWSAAGVNWAAKIVDKLGLQDLPDIVVSKPELAIDDFLDARKIIKSILWIDPATGEFKRNG